MSSRPKPAPAPISGQTLDRLFLDCAKLETLVSSIKEAMDRLDPAVDSGMVTAEHLMNLAFRIENAERGLIAIAHQIGDTASSVVDRRKQAALIH
jgi:hypothetical protein